ncbi:MAG: T9SS type A sorting domain-containing protein [Prevotellaceae bacterium]|jgi:hypothetical protein|nr:T9SS type A sorting domain-containing protein [Prevotellaceae bacterium]
MKRLTIFFWALVALSATLSANPGDTTWVQTFDFSYPRAERNGNFSFPDGNTRYAKVLMYYTIKCDPTGSYSAVFPCGEWDYDVYTYVLKPTGQLDTAGNPVYDYWQLLSYITPYGGNLESYIPTLNNQGWTYVFDVTDFLPILKDNVILKDENRQELVDIKFAFVEGEPVREVVDIKKIWESRGRGVYFRDWQGFPLNKFDSIVHDTTILLTPDEKQVKLRTTVTGHFFGEGRNCAEFCNNIHTVTAGGQVVRKWDIIQSCGDHPMYPQGGTWLYDRAGWCPGMEGKVYEFNLTPYIQNNAITFDYDVTSDPYGVYRIAAFLVSYGEILQTDDAEAALIISPTDDSNQRRFNPSCFSPKVVIKNIGSNNLTSAEIKYGFEGQEEFYFQWNGNIAFLQSDTLMLPQTPDWNAIEGNKATFYFEIINPNSVNDRTPWNNRLSAGCTKPLLSKQNELLFAFKTNRAARETTWQLTDIFGKVLYENDPNMFGSKLYQTYLTLPNGSYRLSLYDSGGDGLYFFANKDDGEGSATLQYFDSNGKAINLYRFQVCFGRFIHLDFAINTFSQPQQVSEVDTKEGKLVLFPNPPIDDLVNLDLLNLDGNNLKAVIFDSFGEKVKEIAVQRFRVNQINVSDLSSGVYVIAIVSDDKVLLRSRLIK